MAVYPRVTRNPGVGRLMRSVPQSGVATSTLDPHAASRRNVQNSELQRKFNTGEVNYDVFKQKLDLQKSNVLGGSTSMANLEGTGQNVQLAEFGRTETGAAQDAAKDPTKYGTYASILQQHQQAFRADSPFYLTYQSKIDRAASAEQDRMDTQVANQYQTGAFNYTPTGTYNDNSVGLHVTPGSALNGFDAYQGYLADQRAKYQSGTADFIKYDSLIRQNFYAKSFSDILTKIGTTQEGQVEQQIRDLIGKYQPGTPQYNQLSEQLKKVGQNKLDNAWTKFLNETVAPSITQAQAKVDLDVTNLVYAMSKGLKVKIDGTDYDFAAGTPQQQQDLFSSIYASLVSKKNQLSDPKNLPEKPVMNFDPSTLAYTFEIPNYAAPEYSSRVSYTPPSAAVDNLPASNVTVPGSPNVTKDAGRQARSQITALGGSYLTDMTAVNNAIRAGKNVIDTHGAGFMIVPKGSLPREKQLTLRTTLTGLGFKYLGSQASIDAAKKAGKKVIQAGGDFMISP